MARVWRGRDKAGRTVAVKVLRADLARRDQVLHRFLREAKILGELDHPAIVRVFSVGPAEPPAYFSMELVEGQGLDDLLHDEKPVGDELAVRVMLDVLGALEHAHGEGVVHRDLKPENVLLTEDGRAKLTDFGIAKVLEGTQLTATGATLGTPEYMAPEQVRGRRSMGPRVDIYAAGILLHELLTGKPPFRGDDPVAIGYAHNFEDLPPLKRRGAKVPEELSAIVAKALEKKPQSRWRSARSMGRALRKAGKALGYDLPRPAGKSRKPVKTPTPARPHPVGAAPGSRHSRPAGGVGVVGWMLRALALMVLASLGLAWAPGIRPGLAARDAAASQQAQRLFLEGLAAMHSGQAAQADDAWRRSVALDPALGLAVRDHAAAACRGALDRQQRDAARRYLALVRWADPGWERGLALERALGPGRSP